MSLPPIVQRPFVRPDDMVLPLMGRGDRMYRYQLAAPAYHGYGMALTRKNDSIRTNFPEQTVVAWEPLKRGYSTPK